VLVDCGISYSRIKKMLAGNGVDCRRLDAVFITHMHGDHVCGLGALLKHVPLRVYAHEELADQLRLLVRETAYASLDGLTPFSDGCGFTHRDLDVLPVRVSHDSEPTVMYKFNANGAKLGVLTDLGIVTEPVRQAFGDCDLLLLESNHDLEMLKHGPYPEDLKRRIRGKLGHLSNRQAVEFITGLERLPRHLMLGHVSQANNSPKTVTQAFTRVETGIIPHTVVTQRDPGPLVEISRES
jgi:phosphoribosyl 1,2-cyclic phosphodiesterase